MAELKRSEIPDMTPVAPAVSTKPTQQIRKKTKTSINNNNHPNYM